MEEKIFVGANYGRFQTQTGSMRDYCNVFVLEDHKGDQSQDYHYVGQKALKYKCISPDIFAGIEPGTKCRFYFGSDRQVTFMEPVK